MKNRTSLFVLAVEILAIVFLHAMRSNAETPSNTIAKEMTPPAKTELVAKEQNHHILLTTLK